ncbi:hypothetical protein A1O7_05838 [Cladophialophora yegresii CBS 114405]|uniref:Uncharacterized protein n=1 Tax=Cladophialophora yegresii CBS 114405 TaxID=1182544 RepID=W9VS93_9EURO|nr:uncharacterized protein A1O7_05838 [Cladophialophora yegresii CBS 114405]EXJ58413.1 hypothetical protein A1O7_05838 [Cladophialophora yegresii CBS 114405]
MHLFTILLAFLTLLLTLIGPSACAKSTATSFCKCICFNNSTIIALNPPPSSTSAASLHNLDIRSPHPAPGDDSSGSNGESHRPHRKLTCADCTRAFCLDYNLPICKDAREEDVFTTCFQRDSLKDETVVVIFVFATVGLLAWAAVKPWVDRLRERNTFMPLGQHDRGQTHSIAAGSAKTSRRAGFGGRAGGSSARSRGAEDEAGPFHVGSYDEDMHAEQDAVDIVSGVPSGSNSGPAFRS